MPDLTVQQRTKLAALRRALSMGDLEAATATIEALQNLDTPPLALLDAMGEGLADNADENPDLSVLVEDTVTSFDESAIPALATYISEDNGPAFLIDVAAEQIHDYDESDLLRLLRRAIRDRDERIREGALAYLEILAEESEAAEALLDETDDE